MRIRVWFVALATVAFVGISGCTVERDEEGRVEDVDVEPGAVDVPDVDIGSDTQTVKVPTIDIDRDRSPDTTRTPQDTTRRY